MQQENVEVVRYLRPDSVFQNPFFGELHDNMYGVTIVYDINYELSQVTAQWSVCNNDNFDKKLGVKIARKARALVFDFKDVAEQGSLTEALAFNFRKFFDEDKVVEDNFHSVIWAFNHVSRILKG